LPTKKSVNIAKLNIQKVLVDMCGFLTTAAPMLEFLLHVLSALQRNSKVRLCVPISFVIIIRDMYVEKRCVLLTKYHSLAFCYI